MRECVHLCAGGAEDMPPYTFEPGSLTEPRARLTLVSPKELPVVTCHSTGLQAQMWPYLTF